jgi:hypothetical protein
MKDYSAYTVMDAATEELMAAFCDGIKILDKEIIRKRLVCIYNSSSYNQRDFYAIIARFNSLVSHKTSAD